MDSEPAAARSAVPPARSCPAVSALDVLGDRWLLLVLREALYGVRRFEAFQEDLGVSRSVLAGRLRRAVALGLLERAPYREGGGRARSEYRPTGKGRALAPALVALADWGEAHRPPRDPSVVRLVHARTGERVRAALVTESGEVVSSLRHVRAEVVPAEEPAP